LFVALETVPSNYPETPRYPGEASERIELRHTHISVVHSDGSINRSKSDEYRSNNPVNYSVFLLTATVILTMVNPSQNRLDEKYAGDQYADDTVTEWNSFLEEMISHKAMRDE
jgi:hypothetical protein